MKEKLNNLKQKSLCFINKAKDFVQEKPLLTAQIIVAVVAVIFIVIVMS